MPHIGTNNGNAYDEYRGIFTCPQSGTYVFMATLLVGFGNKFEAEIVRNGNSFADMYGKDDHNWAPTSTSAVINLSVGDRVWLRVHSNYHDSGATLDDSFSSFSGFCIDCN